MKQFDSVLGAKVKEWITYTQENAYTYLERHIGKCGMGIQSF